MFAYRKRRDYFKIIEKSVANIDKKFLISEVLKEPPFIEAKPYYYLLKKSSKSMREEINREKSKHKDYKEYIEQWIHEVKTPISLIKLIEENNRTAKSSEILIQLEEIDRYVEQSLFYARSEDVDKDYLIKEISLQSCVNSVITRNKQGFILNNLLNSYNITLSSFSFYKIFQTNLFNFISYSSYINCKCVIIYKHRTIP